MQKKILILFLIFCTIISFSIGAEKSEKEIIPYILLYYWDIHNELYSSIDVYTKSLFSELDIPLNKANITKLKNIFSSAKTPLSIAEEIIQLY